MLSVPHVHCGHAHRSERVQTVALSGRRTMRVRTWDGEGSPVVLLHGMLSSAATWRPLVHATPRPCGALDLPGFGASSPATGPRLESFAADVAAALQALQVERCTMVGHSFGGAVAIAVAASSERVEDLVLLAPGGHGSCGMSRFAIDPRLGLAAAALVPVLACSSAFAARPTAAELPSLRGRLRILRRELRRAAAVGTGNARTAVHANEHETASGDAAGACAARFAGRVTILWGDGDRIPPPSHGEAVRRALPGSKLRLLRGAGHALHRERPETIARILAAGATAVA